MDTVSSWCVSLWRLQPS